jgi:hypothetical protein
MDLSVPAFRFRLMLGQSWIALHSRISEGSVTSTLRQSGAVPSTNPNLFAINPWQA